MSLCRKRRLVPLLCQLIVVVVVLVLILFLFSGVVFCWGTFVSGCYLPTATTWLYGCYHLATAHLPLVVGLAARLNVRADMRPQHSRARSIRSNGLMLLIVLKQLWLGRLYMISITNFLLYSLYPSQLEDIIENYKIKIIHIL